MRPGERRELHAARGDAHHGRIRRHVDLEETRAGDLRGDADIRHRHAFAVRERAGLLVAREVPFHRGEPLADPVLDPFLARRLVELEFMLHEIAHARHHQRVGVRRIDQRKRAHAGAAARVLRQQRRLRMGFVEIFHDGDRLEQDRAVTVDQRRQQHLRIDLLICRLAAGRPSSGRCSTTSSGTMPLMLSAMRTRNEASERQNE